MNRANTAEVRYGPPTGKGAKTRAEAGRRCEVITCDTVLSTYNSAPTCWLHSTPTHRHALAPTR
jgi:hypothetical protein